MQTPVVGLGAGGHAKVVLDALRFDARWRVVGLVDASPRLHGATVGGVPVLGGDDVLATMQDRGVTHFFMGVGSAGPTTLRRALYARALALGLEPVGAVHPSAVVSPAATLGPGTVLLPLSVVNASARLGANVIVNTHAVVEHDADIGDHVHLATGALIAGGVVVGSGAHVGLGAAVRQGVRVGREAIVGAGAMVIEDVPDGATVAGVPARPLAARAEVTR